MTPEQRLDRLERIARLIVDDGLRARRRMREQNEKIKILIAALTKSEEPLTAHAESRAKTPSETEE